jgi:hypothetical protein
VTYRYSPPSYELHTQLERSLRVHITTSTTTYRLGGVWHNVMSPGEDQPVISAVDVDAATGVRLYFNTPTLVPDSLAGTLAGALAPADPSWTPGTLVFQ